MSELTIDGHRIGVLFSETEIAERVKKIATDIAARKPTNLLVVPILKGSFVFAADLIRAMHHAGLSPEVDFMILSSYRKSTKSSGQVNVLRDIETDVRGRDVLLIDDILESGRTLAFAKDLLAARGAKGTYTAVLLNKPGHLAAHIAAAFEGFTCFIENHHVTGPGFRPVKAKWQHKVLITLTWHTGCEVVVNAFFKAI